MNQEEEIKSLKEHIVALQVKINELAEEQNRINEILSLLTNAQSLEVERLTKLAKVIKQRTTMNQEEAIEKW